MLTDLEHDILRRLGDLSTDMFSLVGGAPSREGDLAEITSAIHQLQRMVLAQCAARMYPSAYRLLGGMASCDVIEPGQRDADEERFAAGLAAVGGKRNLSQPMNLNDALRYKGQENWFIWRLGDSPGGERPVFQWDKGQGSWLPVLQTNMGPLRRSEPAPTPQDRDRCPRCGEDLNGYLYEEPWFVAWGGHPGDSGAGGNIPQDPVAWGKQTCPECKHEWEISG